jgi:uncharacterized protein
MSQPDWYRWQGNKLVLTIAVHPRAKRDEIVGTHGEALKVRITAPPVDGKANAHLCAWFARLCGVAKSQVEVLSGETSRHKRLVITAPVNLPEGVNPKTVK